MGSKKREEGKREKRLLGKVEESLLLTMYKRGCNVLKGRDARGTWAAWRNGPKATS